MDPLVAMINVFIVTVLITNVEGNGKLLIGLLRFNNPNNLKYDGNCCDSLPNDTTGLCTEHCDLLFNVSVFGFKNNSPIVKELSKTPISNNSTTFPSENNLTNPLEFEFEEWPGGVRVEVDVYDFDKNNSVVPYECVDHFVFTFKPTGPSVSYCDMSGTGTRQQSASKLKILLRYECNQSYYDINCLNECSENIKDEKCLKTADGSKASFYDWDILLATGNPISTGMCGGVTQVLNSVRTSTEIPVSTDGSQYSSTIDKSTSAHTYASTPTSFTNNFASKSEHQTSNSNKDLSTISMNIVGETKSTQSRLTDVGLMAKTTTRVPQKQEIRTIIDETKKNENSNPNGNKSKTPLSTENPHNDTVNTAIPDNNDGGVMEYWPAIVGGVLGALVLLAAISFVVYYKRQKDAQIRQDIYNVNPKKWALEPPEENGTSGKSEIALETEPV